MKKVLVVVDCQNDFITGSLRNEEAIKVVPNIVKKIKEFDGDLIIATLDTHFDDYMETREGKALPFKHCVEYTPGWEIEDSIMNALNEADNVCYIEKHTFGSENVPLHIQRMFPDEKEFDIEFVGFCTDICVVSNAIITKTVFYKNGTIKVDASCCAGTSVNLHNSALDVMQKCQIDIVNG